MRKWRSYVNILDLIDTTKSDSMIRQKWINLKRIVLNVWYKFEWRKSSVVTRFYDLEPDVVKNKSILQGSVGHNVQKCVYSIGE